MTNSPDPEIVAIQKRVEDAGLVMAHVLKFAGVGKSTWWRMKNGRECYKSTIVRLNDAITDMIAKPHLETAPARRKTLKQSA